MLRLPTWAIAASAPLNEMCSERDWAFEGQPNPHLNGRRLSLSMGKGLCGGSSINVMVWARGHRSDWDHFAAESGDPAWGYEPVLNYYRRVENWQGTPDAGQRGSGGPVHVEQPGSPQPLAWATLEAASRLGIPRYGSANDEMMEGPGGVALTDLRIKDGKRESMYDAYIRPRDHQLRVYGIEQLRIADASIMPRITLSHTMAPCVVIGERAADLILAAQGVIATATAPNE